MKKYLPVDIIKYLQFCGLSKRKISQCSSDTRLYHDLGFYGDIAEANMELLRNYYCVDLNDFKFDMYFPSEFIGETTLSRLWFSIAPFAATIERRRRNYLPLTLDMIARAVQTKQWRPHISGSTPFPVEQRSSATTQ